MKHNNIKFQVTETVKKYELLKGAGGVVVGVSGGPDSVALISLLLSIQRKLQLPTTFHMVHLNHKLRGKESDEDEAFIRSLAKRSDVGIEVKSVDVKTLSSKEGLSIEEVARRERHALFESVAKKVGASIVAVGHTADDNAETILHRIIRGTGLFGLQGMRPKRTLPLNLPFIKGGQGGICIQLIRPLIFSWREDIIKYLDKEGLPYRIDSSNLQADYFRNKIRLELLPLLCKNYNKKIKDALCRLGEIAQQNYDFLSVESNDVFNEALIEQHTNACVLDAAVLAKRPYILQQLVILECLVRLGAPLKGVGYKNYTAISRFLEEGRTGKTLQLPNRLTLRLEQGKLYIEKDSSAIVTDKNVCPTEYVKINIPGETNLPVHSFLVTAETLENKDGFLGKFKQRKTKFEEVFDMEKIDVPLYVRTRKDGDRFYPLGSKGTKKLKDFFIDEKVPYLKRNSIPIVVMDDQPIWVVGMRIDDRVKISSDTKKVLKITFTFLQ